MNTKKKYKEHKGYWIDKYVQENSDLRLAERIILGDIITVHQSTENYYKSNDRLSVITGLKKRAVQDVLKSLKKKGYINEPKQIRSSSVMTIRRVITPNISFAKKMYQEQLESSNDDVKVSKSNKLIIDSISENDSTVQLDANHGAVLNTSGCSTLHTENTLENNRTHIKDKSIENIILGVETETTNSKVSKENDLYDELVNSGIKVNNNPPIPTDIPSDIPTDIPPDTNQIEYGIRKKVYKAVQSDNYDNEVSKLRELMH